MHLKTICVFTRVWIIILLVSLGLWSCGASIPVTPMNISVDSPKDRLLAGVTVALQNAEEDSSEYQVRTEKGQLCGCIANRRIWTDSVVKEVNKGLKNRSSRIAENSHLIVSMAMPKIGCAAMPASMMFYIIVQVTAGSGWNKTYQGEGAASSFGGGKRMVTTAVERSLSDAVMHILTDEEFLSILKSGR